MGQIVVSDLAHEDLIDIWLYIAEDSDSAADRMLDLFASKFEELLVSPKLGRTREELAPGVRSLSVKSYIVFYRCANEDIEIVRVLSGYRDLEDLL